MGLGSGALASVMLNTALRTPKEAEAERRTYLHENECIGWEGEFDFYLSTLLDVQDSKTPMRIMPGNCIAKPHVATPPGLSIHEDWSHT